VRINLRNLSSDHRPGQRTSNLNYEELMTRSRRQPDTKRGREAIAEFLRRGGGALAAFLFALLGAPLGLVLQSSNRPYIFLIGFLSVMVFYYAPTALMVRFVGSASIAPVTGLTIMIVPLLIASGFTLKRLFTR
jgi:lipopolysaccharide export LptBFGC system permease protein LptF